ncbi:MAG: translational GTPase TypA, partial [Nitrospirota bacterium]|nr:translational GTPase TypA [Nitrospirota bacterium]
VSGRGELHLSILIETMRREGYEFQVSRPQVIYKQIDGVLHEPMEHLTLDLPEEFQGGVIELLGKKKAVMSGMTTDANGRVKLEFVVPARGLIGFRNIFLTETKGEGIMHHNFHGYEPFRGEIPHRTQGALISMEDGVIVAYALFNLQDRGVMFVDPGDKVYTGMVIGEHSRDNDLDVNACKTKKLTNMRASGSDENIRLTPPIKMSLEQAIGWINDTELVELTPKSIRLRKRYLDANERKKMDKMVAKA